MGVNEYDEMLKTGTAPSGGNEYFELLDDSREDGKQALQQSVFAGSKTNPDRQARVIELANRTKLPTEIVDRNFDEVSKKDTQVKPDYDLLIDSSPGLAKWLQDPSNAALAHDDIDTLSKMERAATLVYKRPTTSAALAMPGDLKRAGQTGWNNLNSSAWHLAAAYGLTTPQEAAQAVADANRRANDLRAKMPDYATEFSKVMAEEVGDVDKSFRRFRSSFDSLRNGHITKALTDYHVGGIKTVGETLDMIRAAVIRPRGLTYSTVENLAHSLPSLITGAAGAKTGAIVGGAAGTVVPGVGNVALGTAGAMVGFGAGSFVGAVPVEVGSWINETLQKRGFDMTDPDAILRAYSDPALMTEVRRESERKGLTTAAVDAVFNAFAGKLSAGAKPGLPSKVLRGTADVGVQATGEATSEFAGQVAAKKGLEGASLGEAIQEGIVSLGHSMGETAVGATIQAGGKMRQTLHKDPVQAVEQVATKTDQAVQAQHDAQALMEVGQAVKDSKLAKRLPDKLQNLVEVATEGQEATSVFFQATDWDKHWQGKGLSPATAASQIMGDGGKSYYEAKSTGAQIEIPLANYVAKVATTEHFDTLLSVARTRPDGMTLDEAKVFLQELPGVMDTLANEVTATPAEQTAEESAAKVAGNVTEQLKGAGFDEATVGPYAKLWEAAFRTLGQRAGVDPMALFQKYGAQIQKTDIAQATEGQVFNQGQDIKPFKNSIDAIAFGKTNAGNTEAIAQLEAKMADVDQRIAAEQDTNKKFALTFEHQFYREARDTAKGAKEFQQPAFHGSPHKFDKFSLQKIGTGEGAQAYGWGLYFAGKKEVAEYYRAALTDTLFPPRPDFFTHVGVSYERRGENEFRKGDGQQITKDEYGTAFQAAQNQYEKDSKEKGRVYKVEIPDDKEFLDWDKPLSKQSEKVTKAIKGLNLDWVLDVMTGHEIYQGMTSMPGAPHSTLTADKKWVSEKLASLGIPGIKYLDEGSRNATRWVAKHPQGGINEFADEASARAFVKKNPEYELVPPKQTSNYVVFDDKLIQITEFEQRKEDEARGRITFGNGRQFNIDLLKNADLSTFLHESGHFYLEVLGDLATAANVTAEVKGDYDTILKWLGVESRDKIGKEQHEQWARGFEAYLMEGKAPTSALRQAFARFRAWLVSIYKQMANLNVQLTPEVRGVFDRLLATQEEIAAAESEQNIQPLFADPKSIGMTDKEAEQYTKAVAEARQSAEEELSKKVLAGWKREQQAWWGEERAKVRTTVATQVDAMPVYRALDDLQRKDTPDAPSFKLSKQAIEADFDKDRLKTLPKPFVYVAKGGLHHDTVAEMYGFKSGDELLTALSTAVPKNKFIDQVTDQQMRDAHPDMIRDPDAMKKEALAAVHNEKRSQLLHKELQHLASQNLPALKTAVKRITRRIPPVAAVRAQAEAIVAKKKVRDIKPTLYQQAEARSAKEAVEAVLKGDFDLAFEAKQRELLNHELFRASVNAREEDDATVSYMAKFVKPAVRERLGKAGPSYLEQVDDIMERFDFRRGITLRAVDKRTSLVAWLEEQKAIGFNPVIPEYVLNDAYRKHYKEMTHEELGGVRDTVKNIESMATLKNKLLKAQRMRELDAAVDEAVASIEANATKKIKRDLDARSPQSQLLRGPSTFLAMHVKMANYMRQMDGWKDGGIMWELFARPANEAAAIEADKNVSAGKAIGKLFSVYSATDMFKMNLRMNVPEIGESMSRQNKIAVFLNWGNAEGRQRIQGYFGWSDEQVQAIIDSLDKRDLEFAQGLLDHIDSYWGESRAITERLDGVAPDKVEALPIQTKHGAFRGGYYPLRYNDTLEETAAHIDAREAADRTMRGATIRATTKHGSRTEARQQDVRLPVRFDLGVAFEHISEVIHDQSHYEYLIDANRLLRSKQIEKAVKEHYGDIVYTELKKSLEDIAAGGVHSKDTIEKMLNSLRRGTTTAVLGFKVSTALIQPLGITQSIVRLGGGLTGAKWVLRGLSRSIGNPRQMEDMMAFVRGKSIVMKNRANTQNREINELKNDLRPAGRFVSKYEQMATWMTVKAQLLVDVVTWNAGYEKAMSELNPNEFKDSVELEDQAIAMSDQVVVDSQGGGQVKDLARVQRLNAWAKMFTMFSNYFISRWNMTREVVGRTNYKSPGDLVKLSGDLLLLYWIPTALAFAMKAAIRGDDDDEAPEKLIKEIATDPLNNFILFREFVGALQGYGRSYKGPAGMRFITEPIDLGIQVAQLEADEAFWRSLNETAGLYFHYPAAQLDATIRGFLAMDESDAGPGAVLLGPPRQ